MPPDVYGLAELAALLGVSKEGVRKLRQREDFPAPAQLAAGPVWDAPEIRAWKHDMRDMPRDRRNGSYGRTLSLYRTTGSPTAVARSMGCHVTTVYRRLEAMGEPLREQQ